MEPLTRKGLSDGRFLVPVLLALTGVGFALLAVVMEPSRTRVALIVLSVVMLALAGATLGAAAEQRRRGLPK